MSSPASRRPRDAVTSPLAGSAPNQYPFPNIQSPQTASSERPGRGQSSAAGPASSSAGLSSLPSQKTDTITETDSNAISVLLQPSITRTGLAPHTTGIPPAKQPTSKDIPPVTLANTPHVDPKVFSSYLKQAGALYESFQRAKEEDQEATGGQSRSVSSRRETQSDPHTPITTRRKSSTPTTPATELPSPLSFSPSDRPQSRKSGSGKRRGPLPVAPLSTIPNVYFEDHFQLENPRIFDIVSERSQVIQRPGGTEDADASHLDGRKSLATNAILQEKLSWYMDTVEMHLISSISTASSSFFAALGNLRELHGEAAASVAQIQALRSDLSALDQSMAQGGLKILALHRRRDNVRRLGNAMIQLSDIVSRVKFCEDQIGRGEVEGAIKELSKVEILMMGRSPTESQNQQPESIANGRLIDLRGIKALSGATEDLNYLRAKIGKTFETRFLDALLGDLRRHVDAVPPDVTLERWNTASQRARGSHIRKPSSFPAYAHMDEALRSNLRTNLEGLAQCNCLTQATAAYRDALWREIKALIRRHLPSSSDDDMESTMSASTQGGRRLTQQEKSSILARNLRSLEAEDAENMLKNIYSNVGEALRRLGTQVKMVLDITSTFNAQSARSRVTSPRSPPAVGMDSYINGSIFSPPSQASFEQEDIQQTLDMSNLLGQGVDIAQAQTTKVLKVRGDQTTQLPLTLFLRYFNLNRLFADECEAISGRGGAALKTLVNTHIKEFVRRISENERQRLVEGIDRDKWDAKDFSEPNTLTLTEVLTASTRDVEAWPRGNILGSISSSNDTNQPNGVSSTAAESVKDKVRSAAIDEQKFILPQSAMILLQSISQFEKVVAGIPSLTQDVTLALLEHLKLFNSRSSQLILGAGATRSAGLKNITTKHLALASQALSFVVALVPYIREFVRRHQTNPQGLMIEFDKVKRLYQEHQQGINEKLVDIMSSRATTHVATMKKIDWDAPVHGQGINPYMETLVKETSTLHKVLSKHLPESSVQAIMGPVFESYQQQWQDAFGEAKIQTGAGRDRAMRDVGYLQSRLSKLEGGEKVGDVVMEIIKQKVVEPDKATPLQERNSEPLPNGDTEGAHDKTDTSA